MKNNRVFVCEGVDRSGKDSLAIEIGKLTDWSIPFLIRGPCGYDVYNKLHHKGFDSSQYEELAKTLDPFTYTFFLDCDADVIEKRFIETNEEPLRGGLSAIDNINAYRDTFNHYKNDLGLKHFYRVENNGDKSIEDLAKEIVEIIKGADSE